MSNDATIHTACASFTKSVSKLLTKIHTSKQQRSGGSSSYDTAVQKRCMHLVSHANHVLSTLVSKRSSLENGIVVFKEVSEYYSNEFATILQSECSRGSSNSTTQSEARIRDILTNWFAIYIRLRDGFVLLESGECRHTHDGDDMHGNNANKFKSKLSGALRPDGITRKFSSEKGYTGAGYDEVYDDDVGIKVTLLNTFYKIDGQKGYDAMNKLFDKDGNGAQIWENQMDIVNDTQIIRDRFMLIQSTFINDVNTILSRVGKSDRLSLVNDDKSERITYGDYLDIERKGNEFKINDVGGSLPFGMDVKSWRVKFGLVVVKEKKASVGGSYSDSDKLQVGEEEEVVKSKSKKKPRKVVLEDSSDEDEEEAVKTAHAKKVIKKKVVQAQPQTSTTGIAVRVRKESDVGNSKIKTTSIEEMKRQLGVNTAELEKGREQLEEEQLHSKMAAEDEDLQEGLLNEGSNENVSTWDPIVKACVASRKELRTNELHVKDIDLLRESQEYWENFDHSLAHWKENFQALRVVRKDVASGELDESSDQAYMVRENFREANMLLGIDCMEIHQFFSSKFEQSQQTAQIRSSSIKSLEDLLSKVCLAYLKLAEETYKAALNLVLEHERCQASNTPMTIDMHWEKGQHLLLRSRSHYNIAHSIYELALFTKKVDILIKARKEFNNAIQRAKALRHNAVLICGHANVNDVSYQSDFSWKAEAMIHTLEGMKLEVLASGLHVACSWKLEHTKEALERFDGVFNSVDVADILKFISTEGILPIEIAVVLGDIHLLSMRMAEMSTQSLESMTNQKGWNVKAGDTLLQTTRTAFQRAASVSDQLLSFVTQNVVEYATDHIASKTELNKEEEAICKWWQTSKAFANQKLSQVVVHGGARVAAPRSELATDMGKSSGAERKRFFIHDGRTLPARSISSRTRQVKKNKNGGATEVEKQLADNFNTEFCPDNNGTTVEECISTTAPPKVDAPVYRKWGNEMLDEKERKRCCPPLPKNLEELGISIDVIRALEKKLVNVLPADYQPIDEYRRELR